VIREIGPNIFAETEIHHYPRKGPEALKVELAEE
jgi:hypothetical protein